MLYQGHRWLCQLIAYLLAAPVVPYSTHIGYLSGLDIQTEWISENFLWALEWCSQCVQDPSLYLKKDVERFLWNFLALRTSSGLAAAADGKNLVSHPALQQSILFSMALDGGIPTKALHAQCSGCFKALCLA